MSKHFYSRDKLSINGADVQKDKNIANKRQKAEIGKKHQIHKIY